MCGQNDLGFSAAQAKTGMTRELTWAAPAAAALAPGLCNASKAAAATGFLMPALQQGTMLLKR